MRCRYCGSTKVCKNGFVKGKQRYKCRDCQKNFQEKDSRTKQSTIEKRALAVALYTMSKATYNFMANKIFKCSPTTVMNWIKKSAKEVEMPKICGDIKEIEFDEMWQVLNLVVGAMVSCFFLVDAQVILSIARAAAQGGAWCLTSDSSLLMTAVSVLFGTHLYGILQKAEARVFDVATFERICSAS